MTSYSIHSQLDLTSQNLTRTSVNIKTNSYVEKTNAKKRVGFLPAEVLTKKCLLNQLQLQLECVPWPCSMPLRVGL